MSNVKTTIGLVLVIEDNADWMRMLVKLCEQAGYATRRAQTSEKATLLLKNTKFDAVVADLRLKAWEKGNIDGLLSLAEVSECNRPAAIVVTGHADPDHVRRAFRDFKVIDVIFKYCFDRTLFIRTLAIAVRETRKRTA